MPGSVPDTAEDRVGKVSAALLSREDLAVSKPSSCRDGKVKKKKRKESETPQIGFQLSVWDEERQENSPFYFPSLPLKHNISFQLRRLGAQDAVLQCP